MGIVVAKTQCPSCASRGGDTNQNNLIVYENGSYCFACGYTEKANNTSDYTIQFEGDFLGMTKEVLNKYGVFLRAKGDTIRICFPYTNAQETRVKVKTRTFADGKLQRDFKFHNVGLTNDKHVPLFGYKQKLPPNLLIFEGERDLLVYESMYGLPDDTWHYLALPGTSNARNAAIALADYKGKIHLCFDDDQAGQQAVQEFIGTTPALVNCTPLQKDVCDAIARGDLKLQWIVDDGTVKDSFSVFEAFRTQVTQEPLLDLGEVFQDVILPRKGMLALVAGASGSGKSFWIDNFILKAIKQKRKVLIHSLEMPAGELIARLLYQITGERLLTPEKIAELTPWFQAFDMYLKINTGLSKIETIESQLKVNYGEIDIVIVDTISLFAGSLDWDKLINTCYALKQIALNKQLGNPMVLTVSQMSLKNVKRENVTMDNLFGASGIAHAPDYIQFMDQRDDGSIFFKVLKRDRILGNFSTKNLRYDFATGDYYEVSDNTNTEEINDDVF